MKRFRAHGLKNDQKYAGIFTAHSESEAREKLKAQGYEVLHLEEVRSLWPMASAIAFVMICLAGSLLWFIAARGPEPDLTAPARLPSGTRTPLDVLGTWTTLRSGNYFIAMSGESCLQAMRARQTKDKERLSEMLKNHEIGLTKTYGGGQKVYVRAWHETEHLVEIHFKDTQVPAWIEEAAVL